MLTHRVDKGVRRDGGVVLPLAAKAGALLVAVGATLLRLARPLLHGLLPLPLPLHELLLRRRHSVLLLLLLLLLLHLLLLLLLLLHAQLLSLRLLSLHLLLLR